jgi:hypothetical protein
MKIVLSESQYNKLFKEEKEQKVLRIPGLKFFDEKPWEAWQILQKVLQRRGNPPYTIDGDLQLSSTHIESLGNLQSVGGDLYLDRTPTKSLGNLQSVGGDLDLRRTAIESLGNLQSVGGYLDLIRTPIKSLGNLTSVGGYLDLTETPLSKMYTEEQIREMVNVDGIIFM